MQSILICNSDQSAVTRLSASLAESGYAVQGCVDGMDALTRSFLSVPDLIVAHERLGDLDGFGLIAALRSRAETLEVPIVFLTDSQQMAAADRAIKLGADDVLFDPVNGSELVETVTDRIRVRHEMLHRTHSHPMRTDEHTSAQTLVGKFIGAWFLERLIASGGTSSVYRAVHRRTGQVAALKATHINGRQAPGTIDRFIAEQAILERIKHPHVVRQFEHGVADDMLFIAMELFESGSLAGLLQGPLPEIRVIALMRQIVSGVEAAHQAGITHCDLKPENIMMRTDGTLVVSDFGIACDIGHAYPGAIPGMVWGTPYYMSPEQAAGRAVSPSTDIYSLGVMLQEMLTGELPFQAGTARRMQLLHRDGIPPKLPRQLQHWQALLDRMLAKNPRSRPADAGTLREALQVYAPAGNA